jgi:lysophospholipase L1-like esterase
MNQYIVCFFLILLTTQAYANSLDFSPTKSKVIKIICIGDSITQGGTVGRPEYTYRLPLQKILSSNGYKTDFIGARRRGLHKKFNWPKDFDQNHEGFYGKKTAYIINAVLGDLDKIEAPDIAIIHVGTNDRDSVYALTIIEPTIKIIHKLREINPNVKIILIQIPGRLKYLFTHIWNFYLAKLLSSNKSKIKTVDLYSEWDEKKYTFDGAHPNPKGQELMAKLIYAELKPIIE